MRDKIRAIVGADGPRDFDGVAHLVEAARDAGRDEHLARVLAILADLEDEGDGETPVHSERVAGWRAALNAVLERVTEGAGR